MFIKQISYSSLHSLSCSYQNFLRYEGKLRGPSNQYLALGTSLHLALELLHSSEHLLTFDETVAIFKTEFARIIEDEEVFITYAQLKKSEATGLDMLGTYFAQMESGKISKKPYAVELEFRLPIAGIDVVGKIDKVETEIDENGEEQFIVTDYKSGSKKPDLWFLDKNLQFTCYSWALKELYGKYPTKLRWHQLRTGEILETTRSVWDIDNLKRAILGAIKSASEDIRWRNYNEQICNYCDYRGVDGACDDPNLEGQILARRFSGNL